MSKPPVIAIDGPSGSGKGTLARRIAERFGFHLLDSGAIYRISALNARARKVDLEDEAAVIAAAQSMDVRFELAEGEAGVAVWLDGQDVTREVRAETTGMLASRIAPMPGLRAALLDFQRDFRQPSATRPGG